MSDSIQDSIDFLKKDEKACLRKNSVSYAPYRGEAIHNVLALLDKQNVYRNECERQYQEQVLKVAELRAELDKQTEVMEKDVLDATLIAGAEIVIGLEKAKASLKDAEEERLIAEEDKREAQQDRDNTFSKFKSIHEENKRLHEALVKIMDFTSGYDDVAGIVHRIATEALTPSEEQA